MRWRDVYLLIFVDGLEVVVEVVWAACLMKVGRGVVRQAFFVELALEVLECQCIVEDGGVTSWRRVEVGPLL